MCTVVLHARPGHAVSLVLAANRDEMLARPWDSPAAYWPDHPGVVAGRDREGGGTWMGINRHGLIAAILNRPGSLGPAAGKRSRGVLPLIALESDRAEAAAGRIGALDASCYRSFNMVLADRAGAVFIRWLDQGGRPEISPLPSGTHMITAHDPDDRASPRVARHLPRFRAAPPSGASDWEAWRTILADRSGRPDEQIDVVPRGGFGTVCSSFVVLPAAGPPTWLFAAGPPHKTPFIPVALPAAQ